jgi:BirA family biotin operon repressor/biotin-[acetyl-CoA-carboxylase] ligase
LYQRTEVCRLARILHPGRIVGMLDEGRIRAALPIGGLGVPLHVLQTVGSTNDHAAELARRGAPHGTLVVADEQTSGRGRRGREWFTPAGGALAVSVVIRPGAHRDVPPAAWNTVGALAVVEALRGLGVEGTVKWPNDVLLGGRKVSGILAEAVWKGDEIDYLILGIGVNVRPESVPPEAESQFPATSLEQALGRPVDREELLARIVGELSAWAPKTASDDWRRAAEARLAYRGEWVTVQDEGGDVRGKVVGLEWDGRLILESEAGESFRVGSGAATIRRVEAAAS